MTSEQLPGQQDPQKVKEEAKGDSNLENFMKKESTKLDRETELRKKIEKLEAEKQEILSQKSSDPKNRAIDLDIREFAFKNRDKFPALYATNSYTLISEELQSSGKSLTDKELSEIFAQKEENFESYELRKKDLLKGTPIYNKIYGSSEVSAQKVEEEKKEVEKPKDFRKSRPVKDFTPVQNAAQVGKITPQEAHKAAYEAYLAAKRSKS